MPEGADKANCQTDLDDVFPILEDLIKAIRGKDDKGIAAGLIVFGDDIREIRKYCLGKKIYAEVDT